MRALVARNLEGRGVNLHPQTSLTQVSEYDGTFHVSLLYKVLFTRFISSYFFTEHTISFNLVDKNRQRDQSHIVPWGRICGRCRSIRYW